MVAHVAELCRVFIYFAMLSDDKATFTGQHAAAPSPDLFRLRSRSLKIKDTKERAAAPSADLFRLRSRSLKIKDTTERAAAPSPDLFRLRSRSLKI